MADGEMGMGFVGPLNLGLRFGLELAMLFAFGYWGFATADNLVSRVVLGIGAPVVAIVVWGMFIAPRARRLLPDPDRLVLEVALFGSAVAGLVAADRWEWAVLLAALTVANLGLMIILDQRA